MSLTAGIAEHTLQEILGYLNFSSGASDPAFLRRLNEIWGVLEISGGDPSEAATVAHRMLAEKLERLAAESSAFHECDQARNVLRLIFDEVLPAYRQHHRDLLFHQPDAQLWRPLFVGRVAEAVLTAGSPWDETERIVEEALGRLNDFLGHRPLAVLETHKPEPYPHERVRPVPLFIAGAGVAVGKYHNLIERTLEILRGTDADLLRSASFDLQALDELAFDPRAYDFNHPANRRPNYHFGQWDPHLIDNRGRYRRFVLQQCALDAVLARLHQTYDLPLEELMFEAAAVLAGTILMAAGTSGSGPESHDSTVSLATLLPRIARYRDEFYTRLIGSVGGDHRQRLEAEATSRHQPFAGARQHLNSQLSRLRALQMQHGHLAILFARLGFADAAERQANIIPAASARLVCQMQCRLSGAGRAIDNCRLDEAFTSHEQFVDLLERAIECGAVIDPWNILGFGGQFTLFPAVENSIPDSRVDDLIELMDQAFDVDARLWHAAATAEDVDLARRVAAAMRKLATWWDRFATTSVDGIRQVSGDMAFAAAEHVAAALAAWHKAGSAAATVAFWRPHADEFDEPQAYAQVIETLLAKPDLPAAMALLMHWLGQADAVGLDSGPTSFFALALRWLQAALADVEAKPRDVNLVLKFFDYLEANAEGYWEVPKWQPGAAERTGEPTPAAELDEFDDDEQRDDDDQDDLYGAAYEDMVYRDTTSDGTDADMLEVPGAGGDSDDELQMEMRRLSDRLAFLAMLAALWKMMALDSKADGPPGRVDSRGKAELPAGWRAQAAHNRRRLLELASAVQKHTIAPPSASYEALVEYDRQRVNQEMLLEKVTATIVATSEAELLLAATQPAIGDETGEHGEAAVATAAPQTIRMWSAVLAGDIECIRRNWGAFLAEIARLPLLYVPLNRGGDARKIAQARAVQQSLRELLRRLPRLGLLRETCQLLRVARAMEKEHPAGPGAVTEFDRLFEIGYQAIVECLVESSSAWKDDEQARTKGQKTGGKKQKAAGKKRRVVLGDAAADAQLIDCLQQVTESLLSEWLSHSRTLRLSVLERVSTPKAWQNLVKFIQRYGHDLFTQQFFHLGNLRAILHQGVDAWIDRLLADDEAVDDHLLLGELDHGLSRADAKKHLSLVIEAVVENYAEYRDYNATTTQSDRGEQLFMFLDFLRVKVAYERIQWNLRPVLAAHEVLVRCGATGAAELWRRTIAQRTSDVADEQVRKLAELQTQYGMRLANVADRLAERFVRPLAVDRVRALVAPAAEEARKDGPPTAFSLLEQEAGELAQEPSGAGLDPPDWLDALEDEVTRVTSGRGSIDPDSAERRFDPPAVRLTWEEIQSQLTDWDTPPEIPH